MIGFLVSFIYGMIPIVVVEYIIWKGQTNE